MVMLYKSCRCFHLESNKIEIAFFLIFYNFLQILQVSAKPKHYLRIQFLHAGPWKELRPCNWVLGRRQWRLRPNSGEGIAGEGRGRAEEARGITWGSILRVGWGGGAAGAVLSDADELRPPLLRLRQGEGQS
jgi:hypothetical protein